MHKLLLADDSVTIQRVIELTFSGEDVQVVAVNDGEQAIARIPLERPDVVLADIGMPRKGGYDVAAFVKGRPDLAHIPVLLLAGAFEPVDQARAEQVHADGVLIKPFEPRQVIERVKELLAAAAEAQAPPEPPVAGLALPAATATGSGTDDSQSLDDLFESLNQALNEPERPLWPSEVREPAPSRAEPPAPFEPLAAPPSNGATLDDYFDRLSAAFEQASAAAARLIPALPERLEDAALPAPSAPVVQSAASDRPAQEWLMPNGSRLGHERRSDHGNPILEAVTALMAREGEDRPARSAPAAGSETPQPAAPPPASQDIVDAVAARVLARLAPEVAESLRRLVQQELARTQR